MSVLVVRHATAGNKREWTGDDDLRPLDARGREQAERLADALGAQGVRRVLSSAAVRCVQTLAPLAERIGLEVEVHPQLVKDASPTDVRDLLASLEGDHAVVCTHGELIEALLGKETEKGSTVEIDAAGDVRPVAYTPPAA